ncbi:hypothetical protein BpHYR1_017304 [Brachionus plicatilis]|uniref:Secreted protein n=1 Tax=Brachionus plicatilis TaxID=10195 RepID=A0A3M7R5I1_BRAPC|nr:hypothetical protein BpHYR1_017304 [Brachionus plicatilis]
MLIQFLALLLIQIVLNGEFRIAFKVVPQSTDQLADHNVIGVLFDNAQQHHTVLLQVVIQKSVQHLAVNQVGGGGGGGRVVMRAEAQPVVHFQVALDKGGPRRPRERRALNRVSVIVLAQSSDHKVAHGDARKPRTLPKVSASDQVANHIKAVHGEIVAHERIEQKKLAQHIHQVEYFDEHVQAGYVVAGPVVGQEASGEAAPQTAQQRLVVVAAVVVDGPVDQLDRVSHGLVAGLGRTLVHRVDDFHDGLGVQAVRLGQQVPQAERHVKKERHGGQNERHPLIVVHSVLSGLRRIGQ